MLTLISTDILVGHLRLGTRDSLVVCLALQRLTGIPGALSVHSLLQSIALPAKKIITMDAITGVVPLRPVEWLRAVRSPVGLVVELARVEHDLVHDLRDLDGVGGRARASALKGAAGRVGDVALVVRAVRVLAVPAGREGDRDAPPATAGRLGKALGVAARAGGAAEGVLLHVGLAPEAQARRYLGGDPVACVADEHAETGLEGCDLGAGLVASDAGPG
jgi:hypothetical protein